MANLRFTQARIERLNTLIRAARAQTVEAQQLREKLRGKFQLSEAEETTLKNWLAAIEKQRRRMWKRYVADQNSKGGGKLYKWVQRTAAEPHLTTLQSENPTGDNTLQGRIHSATEVWHKLWEGGQHHIPTFNHKLRPLTGTDIHKVLKGMSENKAKGADGWSPKELFSLPMSWLNKVATFLNDWENKATGQTSSAIPSSRWCPNQERRTRDN